MTEAILGLLAGVTATLVVVGVRARRDAADRGVARAATSTSGGEPTSDTGATSDGDPPWTEVLSALRVGIVMLDSGGNAVWENDAVAAATGSRHGRVLVEAACERLRAGAAAGQPPHETVDFAGPPPRTLEVSSVALSGGATACLIEDVTERRRLEHVRTDLVANISHELKTPVGALSVLAETLAGEAESEVVGRLAARMVDESQRMARTIEDLIELSRVEMGAEMTSVPVDLSAVARDAVVRVEAIAERDTITLGVVEGTDCIVIGDPHQLRSAVRNLVDNAVHYSHPGGHVEVRVRRVGDEVLAEVEDRGIGIPASSVDRIFERFYRVDRARSRVTGGTGIGLSIVRHVVHNHGARVAVRSREGEGSTFTIAFPAANGGTT